MIKKCNAVTYLIYHLERFSTEGEILPFLYPFDFWEKCGLKHGTQQGEKGGIEKVGTPRGSDFRACLPSSCAPFAIKIWEST